MASLPGNLVTAVADRRRPTSPLPTSFRCDSTFIRARGASPTRAEEVGRGHVSQTTDVDCWLPGKRHYDRIYSADLRGIVSAQYEQSCLTVLRATCLQLLLLLLLLMRYVDSRTAPAAPTQILRSSADRMRPCTSSHLPRVHPSPTLAASSSRLLSAVN